MGWCTLNLESPLVVAGCTPGSNRTQTTGQVISPAAHL